MSTETNAARYARERISVSRAKLDSLADQLIDADCAFRDGERLEGLRAGKADRQELIAYGRSSLRLAHSICEELLRSDVTDPVGRTVGQEFKLLRELASCQRIIDESDRCDNYRDAARARDRIVTILRGLAT